VLVTEKHRIEGRDNGEHRRHVRISIDGSVENNRRRFQTIARCGGWFDVFVFNPSLSDDDSTPCSRKDEGEINAVNHIRINTYWYNTSGFLDRRQLPFEYAVVSLSIMVPTGTYYRRKRHEP